MYIPPNRHHQYTCIYHLIDTINIHVYTTSYTQSIYMYIPPHIHNQYTCIYPPYTPSIYMYIPPIYTINIYMYITDLVCYTYFHWFFNPECQHIFGKQTGYIFQSPKTIKTWTTKHYASLIQWYNTE